MAKIVEPIELDETTAAAEAAGIAATRDRTTTGRIAGAALIVMVGTIFSRVVAIPRESLIASMFGDGVVTGSFTIAENVLTIFLDLLLSGIASAVLVPVLSEYVGNDQRDRLGIVVGKLLTLVVVGGGVMLLLLELGARGVAWAMTGVGGSGTAYDRNLDRLADALDSARIVVARCRLRAAIHVVRIAAVHDARTIARRAERLRRPRGARAGAGARYS